MTQKLRIVNYAVNGSGVGHLTRLVAINRWIRRYAAYAGVKAEIYFLSSSEADGLLFEERFASFKLPSKTIVRDAGINKLPYLALAKQWVWHSLGLLRPDLLIVDTFPRGSFGELLSALDLCKQKAFVYRPMKEGFARRADFQAMLPLYDAIVVPDHAEGAGTVAPRSVLDRLHHVGPVMVRERVELLERAEARARLGVAQDRLCVYASAGGGGDADTERRLQAARAALGDDERIHLVIGAGPLYRGQRFYGPRVTWLSERATELSPAFDVALSAAGYNSFFELMHAGVPTAFYPQPKVADEQDVRARRAADHGAALLLADDDSETIRAAVDGLRDPAVRARMSEAALALVPRNHARDAASEMLRLVLPHAQLDAAEEALTDDLIATVRELGIDLETVFGVMSSLDPTERTELEAERAGTAAGLATDLLRYVSDQGIPLGPALRVVEPLARKLVRATPSQRAAAARTTLEAFAPFQDWAGAAMVMKTFRVEKELTGPAFAAALAGFLERLTERGDDLYQGLASLSSAQGVDDELPTNGELLRAAAGAAS